jgi:hypothetical protein
MTHPNVASIRFYHWFLKTLNTCCLSNANFSAVVSLASAQVEGTYFSRFSLSLLERLFNIVKHVPPKKSPKPLNSTRTESTRVSIIMHFVVGRVPGKEQTCFNHLGQQTIGALFIKLTFVSLQDVPSARAPDCGK